MGIISWIIMGLVVGALAKLLLPGKDPGGLIVTCLLGIAGAVLGGYLSTMLGYGRVTGFNLPSLLIAVAGSLVLLVAYRFIKKR